MFAVFEGNRILKMSRDKQQVIDYYKGFTVNEQNKMHLRSKINGEWVLMILKEKEG